MKVRERYADESFAVKEEIFRKALSGDESKAFISQLFDCSGHLKDASGKPKVGLGLDTFRLT